MSPPGSTHARWPEPMVSPAAGTALPQVFPPLAKLSGRRLLPRSQNWHREELKSLNHIATRHPALLTEQQARLQRQNRGRLVHCPNGRRERQRGTVPGWGRGDLASSITTTPSTCSTRCPNRTPSRAARSWSGSSVRPGAPGEPELHVRRGRGRRCGRSRGGRPTSRRAVAREITRHDYDLTAPGLDRPSDGGAGPPDHGRARFGLLPRPAPARSGTAPGALTACARPAIADEGPSRPA
jgi:hypothetical protein